MRFELRYLNRSINWLGIECVFFFFILTSLKKIKPFGTYIVNRIPEGISDFYNMSEKE